MTLSFRYLPLRVYLNNHNYKVIIYGLSSKNNVCNNHNYSGFDVSAPWFAVLVISHHVRWFHFQYGRECST